jgi:hypothetical protein
MSAASDKSAEQVVLRVGEADVSVTLSDAAAIRTALREYLEKSSYEDRDALLPWTQGEPRIGSDGTLRIGPWVLGSNGKELYLRYREPPGQLAAKAHKALLKKDGENWIVSDLVMEHISVRR